MMNKYYQLILLLFLTGLTPRVVADALDYTFVSVEYSGFLSTIEGFSEVPEGSGVSLDLSVAVRPHIAIIAGYTRGSADIRTTEKTVDADIKSASIGIMVHLPINDTTDFIVAMSFINGNAAVDINGVFAADVDADGGLTTMGARSMVADKVEINGFINKKSIEDVSEFNISLGTAYYFAGSASVDLVFLLDGDSGSIAFGATKYF
ncbi:MAG: hypothetical protein KAT61_03035 [Gammaproteobacteria bacterium]|nr:hypothetical protein [Gammaproteobacteria bacterium]